MVWAPEVVLCAPAYLSSETYANEGKHMYAVIVTGGKQYRVEKGDVIYVEKLDAEEKCSEYDAEQTGQAA